MIAASLGQPTPGRAAVQRIKPVPPALPGPSAGRPDTLSPHGSGSGRRLTTDLAGVPVEWSDGRYLGGAVAFSVRNSVAVNALSGNPGT
jgi:hypothetical protein